LQADFDEWKTIPIGLNHQYFLENQESFKEINFHGENYNIQKETTQSLPELIKIEDPE